MADQLYLSYWIRGFTEHNMHRHFGTALRKFPFSRLSPRAILRVRAVDLAEPPLLEREFAETIDADSILEAAREFQNVDCAFELETAWELWQYTEEDDWRLLPATVIISCYGPVFASELGEQLRFEFGPDLRFLPQREVPGALTPVRQNIRALLHLVKDLDEALAVDKRHLWSESGGNFAERLQTELTRGEIVQMPRHGDG